MTPECRSFFCPFQWVPVLALIHSLTLLFGRLDRWLACFRLSPSAYVQLLRHACNWPTGFCIRPVEIQCSVISIISFCRPRWATVQISGLPVIVREIVLPHKSQLLWGVNSIPMAASQLPWIPEVLLACGGNFRCWPKADTSSALGRSHERRSREKNFSRRSLYLYKDLKESRNRARKVSGTQGTGQS